MGKIALYAFYVLLHFVTMSTTTETEENVPKIHVTAGAIFEDISTGTPLSINSFPVIFKINYDFDVKIDELITTINECKCKSKQSLSIAQNLQFLKYNMMELIGYTSRIDNLFRDIDEFNQILNELTSVHPSYLHRVNDTHYFELLSKLTVLQEFNFTQNKNTIKGCNVKDIEIRFNEILLEISEFKILQLSCKHQVLDKSVINFSLLLNTIKLLEEKIGTTHIISAKQTDFYYNQKVLKCLNFKSYKILSLVVPILPKYYNNIHSLHFKPIEFPWSEYICKINLPEQKFIRIGENKASKILKYDCKDNNSAFCQISGEQIENKNVDFCIRYILDDIKVPVQTACPMLCEKSNMKEKHKKIDSNIVLFSKLKSKSVFIDCQIQEDKNKNYTISEYPDIGVFMLTVPCYCHAFIDDFEFIPNLHCDGFILKLTITDIIRMIPVHWLNRESAIELPFNQYKIDLSEVSQWKSISKYVVSYYDIFMNYCDTYYFETILCICFLHTSVLILSLYYTVTYLKRIAPVAVLAQPLQFIRVYRGMANRG